MIFVTAIPPTVTLLILIGHAPLLALPEIWVDPILSPIGLTLPAGIALAVSYLAQRRPLPSYASGLWATGLIALGALCCSLPQHFWAYLIGRLLLGVGWGLLLTLSNQSLTLFPGTAPLTVTTTLVVTTLLLMGGLIAHHYGAAWVGSIFLFSLLLPLALPRLIQRTLLPETERQTQHPGWVRAGVFGLSAVLCTLPAYVGIYLQQEGLGDVRTVGLLLAAVVSGAWLGQWASAWLKRALGRWRSAVLLLLLGLGFALFALSDSGSPLLTACSSVGLATGALLRSAQQRLSRAEVCGWVLAGQFLTPWIVGAALWQLPTVMVRDVYGVVAMLVCLTMMVLQGPAGRYWSQQI